MFKILSTYSCKKYIKCNIWRVAVRPSYIEKARFLKVEVAHLVQEFPVVVYTEHLLLYSPVPMLMTNLER
jgi:hypothetical protein